MSEIHIPTTDKDGDDEPKHLLAVHVDPDKIDEDDVEIETIAEEHWDGEDEFNADDWHLTIAPVDVADELALEHGDTLEVHQERTTHVDEARIGGQAVDREGNLEPFPLLQKLIDETVTDSNLRIHPREEDHRKEYQQVRVGQMDTPDLAWFLYKWLGANRIMHNLLNAGGEIEHRKKKS